MRASPWPCGGWTPHSSPASPPAPFLLSLSIFAHAVTLPWCQPHGSLCLSVLPGLSDLVNFSIRGGVDAPSPVKPLFASVPPDGMLTIPSSRCSRTFCVPPPLCTIAAVTLG